MSSARLLTLTLSYQLGTVVLGGLVCLALWPQGVIGFALGGLVAGGNFWAMNWLSRKVFAGSRNKLGYALLLGVKLALVLGLLSLLVLVLRQQPLAIVLGLSTLFVGMALGTGHALVTGPSPRE
jgi:polyferredoxin